MSASSAYGSFTQGPIYVDALAGYAFSNNQMQRQIMIPGLQPRTANGSTGANQALGQVETGYKVAVYAPAAATRDAVRPPAGLDGQPERLLRMGRKLAQPDRRAADHQLAAHAPWARSWSARSGWATRARSTSACGWAGCTSSPMSAGRSRRRSTARPCNAFTVYGATPQRDSAVIGFSAQTAIADATQVYLRYNGELGSGSDNHAFNLGVRITW